MVFGMNGEERIQLNEDTYWTGGPYSTVVKGGYKVLPEIQQLVFEEKFLDAHNLFGRNLMGYPVEQQKYQSLANLHLFLRTRILSRIISAGLILKAAFRESVTSLTGLLTNELFLPLCRTR